MSVVNIEDKDSNGSFLQETARTKQDKYPNAIGIKEITRYFINRDKAEREKLDKNKPPVEEFTLSDSDEDTSIAVIDQSLVTPTPEIHNKTPEQLIKKRKRAELDEEYFSDDESFTSPIISVTGKFRKLKLLI